MPGRPPSKVIARVVPGTTVASFGALASPTVASPMTSGVSVLCALATRMRTREPPSETRTRLRTVAFDGPPVALPVGDAPQAATQRIDFVDPSRVRFANSAAGLLRGPGGVPAIAAPAGADAQTAAARTTIARRTSFRWAPGTPSRS